MSQLKEVIENIIEENDEMAQVSFHSYLTEKMQEILETKKEVESTED